ncbi:receptor-interacting serine/threonine-protein kinase 3 [Notolabrus celidotus]|uniref:receptor-interacting serine/threonine-protein kinase 3 n=1 Tax=Notolabrus celidotus TaxID=1203425 RepID=UPI0014905B70|nr:receptor-interacting serine/threonine-protein kinase 3 [Notolabrus celidotus]
MALSSCPPQRFIKNTNLADWKMIDSGGFGNVFKARHRQLCSNVAIKILHVDDGKSLLREINMMRQVSGPYVIHVLGVYEDQLPFHPQSSIKLGLVMELMERGSLASLQKTLTGTPPWPLVFRLAHQVALGINFLHSLSPPVLHLDLKPSNVLLDTSLNAKLTDFGLSRFYHSHTRLSKKDNEEEGGTLPYMPPEAFDLTYKPTKASDIYSYGILLWSIVTGRKPYENALSTIVRLRIPEGQRPSLDEIRHQFSGLAGSEGLMNVMVKCWEGNPEQRLSSLECTTSTEELYKVHKHAINDIVHQVLKKLDQQEEALIEQLEGVHITETPVSARGGGGNLYASVPTGQPPVQEMAGGWTGDQKNTPRFKDPPSQRPINTPEVDYSRSSMYHKVMKSSVLPIVSAAQTPTRVPSIQGTARYKPQEFIRKCSFSNFLPCYSPPPPHEFYITMSDVTGIQYGNNNTMHITTTAPHERKRHPTAPPSVNLPQTPPRGRRDMKGA